MSTFFESNQPVTLPSNFAQSVLQLQMQMQFEQSSTLSVVKQLNELYLLAIEHYITCQDQRKLGHFQRKLQSLLTHPNTLQVIENKEDNGKKDKRSQQTKKTANYNHTLKSQINKFNSQSNVLVKSMVEGSNIKMERSNRLLSQNIESQEERLRKRMASRSKSKNSTQQVR